MSMKTDEAEEKYNTENIPVDELELEEPEISDELRNDIRRGASKAMKRTTVDYDVQVTQDELEALYLDILRRNIEFPRQDYEYETDEYLVSLEDDCIRRDDMEIIYDGAIIDKQSQILQMLHHIDYYVSDFDQDVKSHAWVYVSLKD